MLTKREWYSGMARMARNHNLFVVMYVLTRVMATRDRVKRASQSVFSMIACRLKFIELLKAIALIIRINSGGLCIQSIT